MSTFQNINNFLLAFRGGTRPNRFKISGKNEVGFHLLKLESTT